ncbi:MAG: HupE/UreJ family protein, partial [Moraxellaceae bacterium]
PAQWIESIIAFSIALAALNNLFPVLGQQQIRIAFGFANVLSDLPINSWSKGVALLSFNLGIELGQLACILVFFPIALALRHGSFYRVVVFRAGSVLACILALLWMTQRILGLNWIPG